MAETPLNVLSRIASEQPSTGSMVSFAKTTKVTNVPVNNEERKARSQNFDPAFLKQKTNEFIEKEEELRVYKKQITDIFEASPKILKDLVEYKDGLRKCIELQGERLQILSVIHRIYMRTNKPEHFPLLKHFLDTINKYIAEDIQLITRIDEYIKSLPPSMSGGKARKTRKISKRVLKMWKDPDTVWGKNPKLEKFWQDLASQKNVVLIYKNGLHKFMNLPKINTQKYKTLFNEFNQDDNILAVLSSNPSQDAYEVYLYPKAKDKSVDYVIKHYKKYFKHIYPNTKLLVPL